MSTFEMICLANSKKRGGRCVAGLRTDGGGWIRPISKEVDGELSASQCRLAEGGDAQPLDVMRITCSRHSPKPHHPEDWIVDWTPWQRVARPAGAEQLAWLLSNVMKSSFLLGNWGDRVPYDAFTTTPIKESLALIEPQEIQWIVETDETGKRKSRVGFALAGRDYSLALTDPRWEIRTSHLPVGTHVREACGLSSTQRVLLTISLSEPFKKDPRQIAYCYKLVAAVIILPSHNNENIAERPPFLLPERDLSEYPDPFAF